MRQVIENRPLSAGALVTAAALFGSLYIIRASIGASSFVSYLQAVLYQFTLGASLLTVLGWWREAGFTPVSAWRHHKIFLVPLLAALSPLLTLRPIADIGLPILPAGVYLLVSLAEETLFRGLLLRILKPLGLLPATAYGAALFGIFHMLRLFLGENPTAVWMQAAHASAVGFAYGAFRWRTNNIWPLILIHALYNSLLSLGSGQSTPVGTEILFIPLAVDGFLVAFGFRLLQLEKRERPPE